MSDLLWLELVVEGGGGAPGLEGPRCAAPSSFGKCVRTREFVCCMWHILGKAGYCFRDEEPEAWTRGVTQQVSRGITAAFRTSALEGTFRVI